MTHQPFCRRVYGRQCDLGNLSARQYADVQTHLFSANQLPAVGERRGLDAAALASIPIELQH